MVVHCETNCNEICPIVEKNQGSLKKSVTSVTKVFYMQYGAFIVKQTATRFVYRQYGGSLCNRLQRDLSND